MTNLKFSQSNSLGIFFTPILRVLRAERVLKALTVVTCLIAVPALAKDYDAQLTATLDPETSGAEVELKIKQSDSSLKKLDLAAPAELFDSFEASKGEVSREGDRVIWTIPSKGGTLTWHTTLNVPKGDSYDARITKDWALLRFEDLIPPLTSTSKKGSTSDFVVILKGPEKWSFETRYGKANDKPLNIDSDERRFDRPTGWLIAGELGIRREEIAKRAVTVAAPVGTHFPRVPTLAFLRWTLPDLERVFPMLSKRLLVVSGNEEMWRGALSGPSSLFLHRDRPLISENGTSPLLHELVHVATRMSAEKGDDWIVEGIAEYYSVEVLRRSDGLSPERFKDSMTFLKDWAKRDNGELKHPSKGADTAAAAFLFHRIALELREHSEDDEYPLDKAIQELLSGSEGSTKVSRKALQKSIEKVTGKPSSSAWSRT